MQDIKLLLIPKVTVFHPVKLLFLFLAWCEINIVTLLLKYKKKKKQIFKLPHKMCLISSNAIVDIDMWAGVGTDEY